MNTRNILVIALRIGAIVISVDLIEKFPAYYGSYRFSENEFHKATGRR